MTIHATTTLIPAATTGRRPDHARRPFGTGRDRKGARAAAELQHRPGRPTVGLRGECPPVAYSFINVIVPLSPMFAIPSMCWVIISPDTQYVLCVTSPLLSVSVRTPPEVE